jgi:hypothetical protein
VDDDGLLVTVTFPPHAVTRRIPAGSENGDILSELTLLLIQMARHAGSLGPPKTLSSPPKGISRLANGAPKITRNPARHIRSRA